MTKKEFIEWLNEPLPENAFVDEKELAKAYLASMYNLSQKAKAMASELKKLDPKSKALQEWKSATAVRWSK